jgi:hypothetical protein
MKKSGLQASLSYGIVAGSLGVMVVPFARLAVGRDLQHFVALLLLVMGLWFALLFVPLMFFLIRFIRYQRSHPWAPPGAADPASVSIRRRQDRTPRAFQI